MSLENVQRYIYDTVRYRRSLLRTRSPAFAQPQPAEPLQTHHAFWSLPAQATRVGVFTEQALMSGPSSSAEYSADFSPPQALRPLSRRRISCAWLHIIEIGFSS